MEKTLPEAYDVRMGQLRQQRRFLAGLLRVGYVNRLGWGCKRQFYILKKRLKREIIDSYVLNVACIVCPR